ncbi:hypothetical protein D7S66_23900 [Ralstonia pickettii]|jgi:hypothetical protein|nr:hypothetical protein [Ralstonia pickettii]
MGTQFIQQSTDMLIQFRVGKIQIFAQLTQIAPFAKRFKNVIFIIMDNREPTVLADDGSMQEAFFDSHSRTPINGALVSVDDMIREVAQPSPKTIWPPLSDSVLIE